MKYSRTRLKGHGYKRIHGYNNKILELYGYEWLFYFTPLSRTINKY